MNSAPKPRVLLADDVPSSLYLTRRVLECAGYTVLEADCGLQALERARELPDAIILDVRMPDLDGFEVSRRLKACPETAAIPILHLSATFKKSEHLVQGLQSGASYYLTQPVEPVVLDATLKAMLRARRLEEELVEARKTEAVARLAAGVAHELNNAMMVIMGTAEMISDSAEPGSQIHNDAMNILDMGGRASRLATQLLAFGCVQVVRPSPIDLDEVLRSAESGLRSRLGEGVELKLELGRLQDKVLADRKALVGALEALADNAREAMFGAGTLTLRAEPFEGVPPASRGNVPSRLAVLSVTDTGRGMDAFTQARLFEPFFTTKPFGANCGLSLPAVHGTIRQLGGSILVDSEPGKGTTFRLFLPRLA